jgi:hypothetical protein
MLTQSPRPLPNTLEEPGVVWSERRELGDVHQVVFNSTPVLKMDGDRLLLDVRGLRAIAERAPVANLLSRFRESASARMDEYGGTPVRKRALGATAGVDQSSGTSVAVEGKRRRRETDNPGADPVPTVAVAPVVDQETLDFASIASQVQFMRVPCGCSAHDRLALFDTQECRLTCKYVQIPADAGDLLPHVKPGARFRVLLTDGDGFSTGGSVSVQHAVRLPLHRQQCRDSRCNVMGCGADPTARAFRDAVEQDMVQEYYLYHRNAQKRALRARGRAVREHTSWLYKSRTAPSM